MGGGRAATKHRSCSSTRREASSWAARPERTWGEGEARHRGKDCEHGSEEQRGDVWRALTRDRTVSAAAARAASASARGKGKGGATFQRCEYDS